MPKRTMRVVKPGERTNPEGKPVSNRILLSLPDAEYRSIRKGLEFVPLPHHRSRIEKSSMFISRIAG
jgi:hypothetical protein